MKTKIDTEHKTAPEMWPAKRAAWLLGITDRTFRRLVEEEVIHPVLVPKTASTKVRKYDPVKVVQDYCEYKVRSALRQQSAGSGKDSSGAEEDYKQQIAQYRAALLKEQAAKQKYQNEINRGVLVYASEVSEQLRVFFGTFKRFALSIPSRVTGIISGLLPPLEIRRVSQEISKDVTRQLEDFVSIGNVQTDGGDDADS